MKFVIAVLVAAFVCIVTSDPPPHDVMVKMIADEANAFTGTADAYKAMAKEKISKDPNQYTLEEVNKFLDEVCKLYKATFMTCTDYREFIIATKKAAGKIKA